MTKEEFLRRCETIWNLERGFDFTTKNKGVLWQDRKVSRALLNAADCYLRLRDVYEKQPKLFKGIWDEPTGQGQMAIQALTDYQIYPSGEGEFKPEHTLASDDTGYAAVRVAAVLDHFCQKCGEDVDAWHTRQGFCPCQKDDSPFASEKKRIKI